MVEEKINVKNIQIIWYKLRKWIQSNISSPKPYRVRLKFDIA